MSWRYFATTLHGDGRETLLADNLPLTGVQLTHTLSGVNVIDASLPVEIAHLKDSDGNPVFRQWHTAIYAEKDGYIRAGGIITRMSIEEGRLALSADGFVAYLHGLPYEGDESYIQADPMNIARHLWEHAQSFDGGNLGVVLDHNVSPVRIGTEEREVEFETGDGENVQFESGPYRLNYWTTFDLGREFDALADETPFDYREHHEWVGDTIRHRIELGYPRLGEMREDLRFVYGENVTAPLSIGFEGDDYASEVIVLGAGEGRRIVRQRARVNEPRGLRRVAVVEAKDITSGARAYSAALKELALRFGDADIATVTVRDHPNAPVWSIQPGDFILVQNYGGGWGGDLYIWVRVLEVTVTPEDSDTATLMVTREERAI